MGTFNHHKCKCAQAYCTSMCDYCMRYEMLPDDIFWTAKRLGEWMGTVAKIAAENPSLMNDAPELPEGLDGRLNDGDEEAINELAIAFSQLAEHVGLPLPQGFSDDLWDVFEFERKDELDLTEIVHDVIFSQAYPQG